MSETRKRAKYTLEFKMEAVRLVKGGTGPRWFAKGLCDQRSWGSLQRWFTAGFIGLMHKVSMPVSSSIELLTP